MNNNAWKVLVVDDDESICKLCINTLKLNGYAAIFTCDPREVKKIVQEDAIDLVLTDIKMPMMSGLDILQQLKNASPDTAVVIMTAYGSLEVAIHAVNYGAYSFIPKPFHLNEMVLAVKNALERKKLIKEIVRLKTLVNLFHVTEKMNSTLEISDLLQTMINAVVRETNSEKALVFYRDDESDDLYVRCGAGTDFSLTERDRIPLKNGVVDTAFQKREAILLKDASGVNLECPDLFKPSNGGSVLVIPMQSNDKNLGLLSLYKNNHGALFTEADKEVASILAAQAAVALDNAELILDYEILFLESMKSLAKILDERDPYTHGHSQRVAKLALEIGHIMQLSDNDFEDLYHAGILHDIGKIGIRDDILLKPGALKKEEYEIIKTHPEKGYNIIKPIKRLSRVAEAVYTHHEWYNGNGYPRNLRGDDIPLIGGIIAVADAYDTITTDRIYREHRSHDEAIHIIMNYSTTQFHPEVVQAVEKIVIFEPT